MFRLIPLFTVITVACAASVTCSQEAKVNNKEVKVNEKIVAGQLAYQKETEKLREGLLASLKKAEDAARKAGNKTQLDKVKDESAAFEANGTLPSTVSTKDYCKKLHKAKKSFEDANVLAIKAIVKAGNDDEAEELEKELNEFRNTAKILNGKQYAVVKAEVSWNEARLACEKQGGHLAILLSESEAEFAAKLQKAEGLEFAFIGATDARKEGQWYWIDGSRMTYSNWDVDHQQPNNRGPGGVPEHYAGIASEHEGKWWDLPMQHKTVLGYICQWD